MDSGNILPRFKSVSRKGGVIVLITRKAKAKT